MRTLLPTLILGASHAAGPASAAIYSTTFSGTVASQAGTSFANGAAVTGAFTYSSDSNQFLSFRIGTFTASQPYVSQVTTVPSGTINPFEATYSASSSAAQTGGTTNTSFALDLEALTSFSTGNALTLLTLPNLLSQLDTNPADNPFNSTFSYYNGNANGTGVTRLSASLTSLSTSVPEPASLALLAAPMIGLVFRRRN